MAFFTKKSLFLTAFCSISAATTCFFPLKSHADLISFDKANATKAKQTRLSFHTEAQIHIQPNLLILHLSAEHAASTPAKAQAELDQIVSRALLTAHKGEQTIYNLDIQTGDYAVNQTGSESKSSAWRAAQHMLLKAPLRNDKPQQAEALLRLAGTLQTLGISLNEIEWTLDEATKKSATDKAVQNALSRVIPEAQHAGKTLGLSFISLDSVNIDRPYLQAPAPRAMLMGSMANRFAEKLPPQSSAHELEISATANAVALLGKR